MKNRKTTKRQERRLEKMAEEATTDYYNEHEMFSGWACTLEDELRLPAKCKILGEEASLVRIDTDENGKAVLGTIMKDGKKIRIPAQDIELEGKNPKGRRWLDAYRYWLKV